MLLHDREATIGVKQLQGILNTECADQHVDSFPHRYVARAEEPIIGGRLDCDVFVDHRHDGEAPHGSFDPRCLLIRGQTLQHLAQHKIAAFLGKKAIDGLLTLNV